jgi:hypothetical protein
MTTVAGIFDDRMAAEQSFGKLQALGLEDGCVDLLEPGAPMSAMADVPTADTEQPGMGRAVGSVVGGALGIAGGLSLGTATAAALLVPGVGPILAAGTLGAALLGVAGAVGGGAVGKKIDRALLDGLPKDELFVYEDALRQGKSLVIALARDDAEATEVRRILERNGAESIDAARHRWWTGLRGAEREHYVRDGSDFESDEEMYRKGFEVALDPEFRGKSWEQALYVIVERNKDWDTPCFRKGFERGQRYWMVRQDRTFGAG